MITDTETFYVIANICGGYRSPMFTKDIGTGTTDSWGDAATADRYDTRKEALLEIRHMMRHGDGGNYRPMRVKVTTKIYN